MDDFNPSKRVAECPDEDATELRSIEVDFAIPVLMTQHEQRRLVLLISEMCSAPWNQPVEGVHWLAECGSKPSWSKADAAMLGVPTTPDSPDSGEPTFNDEVFQIGSCARGFVSDIERKRTLRRRTRPERTPEEQTVLEAVAGALTEVALAISEHVFLPGQVHADPAACLEKLCRLFAPLGRKCGTALARLWEHEAKRQTEEV